MGRGFIEEKSYQYPLAVSFVFRQRRSSFRRVMGRSEVGLRRGVVHYPMLCPPSVVEAMGRRQSHASLNCRREGASPPLVLSATAVSRCGEPSPSRCSREDRGGERRLLWLERSGRRLRSFDYDIGLR